MITEQAEPDRESSLIIQRWSTYLEALHARIAPPFSRHEVGARAYRYLSGLLGEVGHKNSWQMAEAIGEAARGPTPPQRRPLGRRSCARRSQSLRSGTPRGRGERCAHRRRDRLFEAGLYT